MTRETLNLTAALRDYLLAISPPEHPVLRALREETAPHPRASMQIGPEQGRLMAWIVGLIGARRTIEVGVFTGYSSLAVALALPADGRVLACDTSAEHTAVARRHWAAAGVEHKIDLRLGPARATLDALIAAGEQGRYDFAFVDADKENDAAYYEQLLVLVRPGGVIAVDNVLWSGRVIDPLTNDADTVAIRRFNELVRDDDRVDLTVIPIGDGLTLARKR